MRISVYSPKMSGHIDFVCDEVRLISRDRFVGDISITTDGKVLLKTDTKDQLITMENGVQPLIIIIENAKEE